MFRKFVAVTLGVSFLAMASSGLAMFFIAQTSFTIQMHPVHKLFGILLVMAAVSHITLNFKLLRKHLTFKRVTAWGIVLLLILIMLWTLALNRPVPADKARELNQLSAEVEQLMEGEK